MPVAAANPVELPAPAFSARDRVPCNIGVYEIVAKLGRPAVIRLVFVLGTLGIASVCASSALRIVAIMRPEAEKLGVQQLPVAGLAPVL